ncbi:hypothetical protein HYE82_24670, partial [Streptomyces sp. BR123]|nr:hypothetical protein [Streptomyces sp. BR123]
MSQQGADDWWQKLYENPDAGPAPDPGDTLESRYDSAASLTCPPPPPAPVAAPPGVPPQPGPPDAAAPPVPPRTVPSRPVSPDTPARAAGPVPGGREPDGPEGAEGFGAAP